MYHRTRGFISGRLSLFSKANICFN